MEVNLECFQYELNAFLSAARNVTFVLQASMSKVKEFDIWYADRQFAMKNDPAMKFFLELRNVSQKQGPVAYVAGRSRSGVWTFRFVEDRVPLPHSVLSKDVRRACAEHLRKLGCLLLDCSSAFPFQACPATALSKEGMDELGFTWEDVEALLGLPQGYVQVGDFPAETRFEILRREVEPLDLASIKRIASNEFKTSGGRMDFSKFEPDTLTDYFASNLGAQLSLDGRSAFLKAVKQKIDESDNH